MLFLILVNGIIFLLSGVFNKILVNIVVELFWDNWLFDELFGCDIILFLFIFLLKFNI